MSREYVVEYEFTSTKADGDSYKRRRTIKAKNVCTALLLAKIEGFREFGARFNDNCIDWNVVGEVEPGDTLTFIPNVSY